MKKAKIIFLGTPDFAVASLHAIKESGHSIELVVTVPDRKAGRGQKLNTSAVKEYCLTNKLRLSQPEKLRDPDFLEEVEKIQPDIMVVVAFRMLPEVLWRMARLGTFNLHASLLPDYRGAAPINWAIINGDTKTGVTSFMIDNKIDTGNILLKKEIDILPSDDARQLHDRLMLAGAELVTETITGLMNESLQAIPQSAEKSKQPIRPAPKLFKDDCKISWDADTHIIYNKVRGLSPYPAAFTTLISPDKKEYSVKLFKVAIISPEHEKNIVPGSISTDGKSFLHVYTKNGCVSLLELQLAGKRKMKTEEFLRGFPINSFWKSL